MEHGSAHTVQPYDGGVTMLKLPLIQEIAHLHDRWVEHRIVVCRHVAIQSSRSLALVGQPP